MGVSFSDLDGMDWEHGETDVRGVLLWTHRTARASAQGPTEMTTQCHALSFSPRPFHLYRLFSALLSRTRLPPT